MSISRLNRLIQGLPGTGQQAIVLNPGPSLAYLTGVHFFLYERPIVAFFTPDQPPALVLPELEIPKAQTASIEMTLFAYQDNPATRKNAFQQAARFLGLENQEGLLLGVEPDRLRLLEIRLLEAVIPHMRLADAEVIVNLRMHKDEEEIACIRRAIAIAEAGLSAALPLIKIGMTEKELSAEIGFQVVKAGSEGPSNPMVESGPNSANPHATVSNRKLVLGDALVIDFGALYHGYCADITRTFAVGQATPELETIARITAEANTAGRAVARPGIAAGDVDRAARAVIERAGYGPYFTHRTGHGLGSEPHEAPYIFAENEQLLEPGMVFTVEPGIYLPARAGARVEDDMLITPDGVETLSSLPRELRIVG
jgi:Xaa-Pro dipeptidase